jgi:hypothetical protein
MNAEDLPLSESMSVRERLARFCIDNADRESWGLVLTSDWQMIA